MVIATAVGQMDTSFTQPLKALAQGSDVCRHAWDYSLGSHTAGCICAAAPWCFQQGSNLPGRFQSLVQS